MAASTCSQKFCTDSENLCILELTRVPSGVQPFQQLPRDRLTALAVFCRRETLPPGRVLVQQGETPGRIFLLCSGEVAHVLEGSDVGNPMHPYARRASDLIPGIAYLAPGCTAGMRSAVDKRYSSESRIDRGMVQTRCALFSLSAVLACRCHHDCAVFPLSAAHARRRHYDCGIVDIVDRKVQTCCAVFSQSAMHECRRHHDRAACAASH